MFASSWLLSCQVSQPVIMVPTPSSVSSSIRIECRARPSMMWAAPIPCARHRTQHSICGASGKSQE